MPGDASAGACSTLAGSWIITGTCGADLCTITQAGCVITQVTCNSGTHSSSGTINGAAFTYTGQTTNGDDATCTGTIAGNTISGTCNVTDVGTCSFSGTK